AGPRAGVLHFARRAKCVRGRRKRPSAPRDRASDATFGKQSAYLQTVVNVSILRRQIHRVAENAGPLAFASASSISTPTRLSMSIKPAQVALIPVFAIATLLAACKDQAPAQGAA